VQPLPLGAAVRALRLAKGRSVRETAAAAGISRPQLDRIERGGGVTVGGPAAMLERLAAALGVRPSALVRQAEIEARRTARP
jgi:transcriptional regulator with XRE-family HTH domain